jgi:peptidyl-prolyl cis-trans isomerase SurA
MRLMRAKLLLIFSLCFGLIVPVIENQVCAETAVALVNGTALTLSEVRQRERIGAVLERQKLNRQQATDAVIDDRLKIQEALRLGYRINDDIVQDSFERLARGNGGLQNFKEGLRKSGISETAIKNKLKADIAWDAVLRAGARNQKGVSNAEIDAALAQKKAEGQTLVYDYQLQQVVFIVPGGSGDGTKQAAQARAVRKAFSGCKSGFAALRGTVDVAVKAPFTRSSSEMSAELAALLSKTAIGALTEPFATGEGIEMIAVCARKERQDLASARSKIEQEAAGKATQARAASLLEELRAKASIEYRR